MKKIILLLVISSIMLSSMSILAIDTGTYNVNIKIYDINNRQLSLNQATFHVETGDFSINGYGSSRSTYGYGYSGLLDAKISNQSLKISTSNTDDIKFIAFGDLGDYHYHIEETIPYEDLIINGTINLTYNLSDMNEITLSTTFDEKTEGQFKYFLYKIDEDKIAKSDEVSGGWGIFDDPTSKTIYVSEGTYNLTFMNEFQTTHRVYKKNNIIAVDDLKIEVNPSSKDFNHHILNISDIYDNYTYYCIELFLPNKENLDIWNSRNASNKLELYMHKDIDSSGKFVYLSNEIEERYNKSVTTGFDGEITLANKYHYSEMMSSLHKDGTYGVNILMKDDNDNELRFIQINRTDDVNIEIYDKETYELVFEDGFSSYWDTLEHNLDESKSYTARIFSKTDTNVNATSYFDLTFDKDGRPFFRLLEIIYDSEIQDIVKISIEQIDEGIKLELPLSNNTGDMKSYNIYKNSDIKTLVKTVRVAPYNDKVQEIILTPEELSEYPNTSIVVERNSVLLTNIYVADLMATDVRHHWADNQIIKLMSKGVIFNRGNNTFEPNEYITRGEFSAFLSNALSLELGDYPKTFSDIESNHELYQYIRNASSNGLINGYVDGTFKVDNSILRQDVAMIIDNAFRLKNIKLKNEDKCKVFVDYGQIDNYAIEAINMCITNGIITGKPGKKLDPKENLSRAEAAVVITKVLKILNDNE